MNQFKRMIDALLGKTKSGSWSVSYSSIGANIMANVELVWQPNPPEEGVTGYVIYRNGTELARTPQTSWVDPNVTPGQYVYEVAPVNVWGDGPHSDPAKTPPAASKPAGVILSIKVTVQA